MDLTLVQGTLAGLKTASDIAKSILQLKIDSEIQVKVIELQQAILSAQSSAMTANAQQYDAQEQIRTLKEQIAKIKAWEIEKQRYKLMSPWGGSVVYAVKESMSNSEPPHYICTKCFEDGKKSILNQKRIQSQRTCFACPICKSEVQTDVFTHLNIMYAND